MFSRDESILADWGIVELCKRDLDLPFPITFLRELRVYYEELHHSFIWVDGKTFGLTVKEEDRIIYPESRECYIEGPGYIDRDNGLDKAAAIEGFWGGSCQRVFCKNELALLKALQNAKGQDFYFCLNPNGNTGMNCQEWAKMMIDKYCH